MNYPDKIELVLTYKYDPQDTEIFTEKIGAEKVGDYYRLMDVPAFAPNIAYGDIVKIDYDDGEFHFDELVEESGFSVVHIVIWKPDSKESIINRLTVLGCGVNANIADKYLVVSIPPQISYPSIRSLLQDEFADGNIDYRDCISKVHVQGLV